VLSFGLLSDPLGLFCSLLDRDVFIKIISNTEKPYETSITTLESLQFALKYANSSITVHHDR
jgi:hypothetical protein